LRGVAVPGSYPSYQPARSLPLKELKELKELNMAKNDPQTPVGTADYPNLLNPQQGRKPGEKPIYSVKILFTHEAMLTPEFKAMEESAELLLQKKYTPEKFASLKKLNKLNTGIRRDLDDGDDDKVYGSFVRLKTQWAPAVYDRFPDPEFPQSPALLTDPNQIYPGIQVVAAYKLYEYDTDGNKGVGFGLQEIQKVADGKPIVHRKPSAFGALEKASAPMDSTTFKSEAASLAALLGGAGA